MIFVPDCFWPQFQSADGAVSVCGEEPQIDDHRLEPSSLFFCCSLHWVIECSSLNTVVLGNGYSPQQYFPLVVVSDLVLVYPNTLILQKIRSKINDLITYHCPMAKMYIYIHVVMVCK